MKKLYFLFLLAIITTTACGGGGDDDEIVTPPVTPDNVLRQNETFPAQGGSRTFTLSALTTGIASVDNPAQWLSATWPAYTSGSPKITLTASVNTATVQRQSVVTVTATDGAKLLLTVTQAAASSNPNNPSDEGTDIDDVHDSGSNQPAYSRAW